MKPVGIGLIGCGVISGAYLKAASTFPILDIRAVADIVVHRWDDDMWARGAAAMTLRDLYGAPWGTTGPAQRRLLPA